MPFTEPRTMVLEAATDENGQIAVAFSKFGASKSESA
jgi:hypothetical protein